MDEPDVRLAVSSPIVCFGSDSEAHAENGMVDRSEALHSRPGGPDRGELAVQAKGGHFRSSAAACLSAAG